MALPALLGAAEDDPLQAALDAVYAAVTAYGEAYRALPQGVWSVCRGRQWTSIRRGESWHRT
ncbi:hypothetical protein [Streptomyces hirsutus]|uniref:hypothetical protein n=1 Tax=Streptomyces hirsutus TaxID=35620 RepID=UPI00200E2925|nr:hypothetical protein [Streptomyces hirsutus]